MRKFSFEIKESNWSDTRCLIQNVVSPYYGLPCHDVVILEWERRRLNVSNINKQRLLNIHPFYRLKYHEFSHKWTSHRISHHRRHLQCDIALRNPFSQNKSTMIYVYNKIIHPHFWHVPNQDLYLHRHHSVVLIPGFIRLKTNREMLRIVIVCHIKRMLFVIPREKLIKRLKEQTILMQHYTLDWSFMCLIKMTDNFLDSAYNQTKIDSCLWLRRNIKHIPLQ